MGRGPSKKKVQDKIAAAHAAIAPRLKALDLEILSLLEIAEKAVEKSAFGPAVQARSRASSLRADRDRLLADVGIELAADAGERLRLMRRSAVQEGSWTAAASLAREEVELQARLEAAAPPPAGDPLEAASPEEVVTAIEETLGVLPVIQLIQLRGALTRALDAQGPVRPDGEGEP